MWVGHRLIGGGSRVARFARVFAFRFCDFVRGFVLPGFHVRGRSRFLGAKQGASI